MDFLRIKAVELFSYYLSANRPLQIGSTSIDQRRGFIIKIISTSGLAGFGDIAPLPGLHSETAEQIPEIVDEIRRNLPEAEDPHVAEGWLNLRLPPSVRFGIESALISLNDVENGSTAHSLSPSELEQNVAINALIDPAEGPVEKPLIEALNRNFKSVKIKMGRQPLETDIKMIQKIYELAGDYVLLRLDCNRRWSVSDTIKFCRDAAVPNIEYLEEPLSEPAAMSELFRAISIPLAVDESLTENEPVSLLKQKWVSAAVVKPSLTGGVFKTLELMKKADKMGKKIVISDTYHSGIGLSILIRLAAVRRKNVTAAGLDTYSRLDKDLLQERLSVREGVYNVQEVYRKSRLLNEKLLIPYGSD